MRAAEFEKIADLLAKEHKIKVKEGQGWAANLKDKNVFYRKEDIYTLSEDHILGLLLHEIAHIHYTEEPQIDRSHKNAALLHSTMNMLEDIAIEDIICKDYANAGEILESTREEVLDTLVRNLPKLKNVSMHEKSLLYAATKFEGRGYVKSVEKYEKIGTEISEIMIKRKNEIYKRKKTNDLMPMAKEIVEILLREAGEPTDQEKYDMSQSASGETNAAMSTENSTAKKDTIKKLGGKGFLGDENVRVDVEYIDKVIDQSTAIGKKLRAILKRNNAMEFAGKFRTGKLLAKRLSRIRVNKDRKPFARRIIKSNQSYAFAVAADISGSMWGGSNYRAGKNNGAYALSALQMVGEALRKAVIPRSLILFGARAKTVAPMSKLPIKWNQIASEDAIIKAGTGNTNIHFAMRAAREQLKNVKAERKIIVILTDGQTDEWELQQEHKLAKKLNIECIGITLGEGSGANTMSRVFADKRNITIKDNENRDNIGQAFIKILQDCITTG
jgi:Mg-chelatase subunit ChlD